MLGGAEPLVNVSDDIWVQGSTGRTRLRLPLDRPEAATAHVAARGGITPYVRLGDAFAWLCVLAAFGSVTYDALRPPSRATDAMGVADA